jgi:hypothetical protein
MGIRGRSSRLSRARGGQNLSQTWTNRPPPLVYDARRNKDPFLSLVDGNMEGQRQSGCQSELSLWLRIGRAH